MPTYIVISFVWLWIKYENRFTDKTVVTAINPKITDKHLAIFLAYHEINTPNIYTTNPAKTLFPSNN